MTSVLFVCLGNICRSPAAEGVLRHMAEKQMTKSPIVVESCGLGDWHLGNLPDERMRFAAKERGYILSSRAKKMELSYFDQFDYILVADKKVLKELYRFAKTPEHKDKLHLMTHFSTSYKDQEVPDPYYLGEAGFERVLDMLEDSCRGLLENLK